MEKTIAQLIEEDDVAFMGSDWQTDESVSDGPFPGRRYVGEKPCILCNDVFFWACADSEEITEEKLPEFNRALKECNDDMTFAAWLYCARIKGLRPQGAAYSLIPKDLWCLFDECGPERKVDFCNPCAQGEYLK